MFGTHVQNEFHFSEWNSLAMEQSSSFIARSNCTASPHCFFKGSRPHSHVPGNSAGIPQIHQALRAKPQTAVTSVNGVTSVNRETSLHPHSQRQGFIGKVTTGRPTQETTSRCKERITNARGMSKRMGCGRNVTHSAPSLRVMPVTRLGSRTEDNTLPSAMDQEESKAAHKETFTVFLPVVDTLLPVTPVTPPSTPCFPRQSERECDF